MTDNSRHSIIDIDQYLKVLIIVFLKVCSDRFSWACFIIETKDIKRGQMDKKKANCNKTESILPLILTFMWHLKITFCQIGHLFAIIGVNLCKIYKVGDISKVWFSGHVLTRIEVISYHFKIKIKINGGNFLECW